MPLLSPVTERGMQFVGVRRASEQREFAVEPGVDDSGFGYHGIDTWVNPRCRTRMSTRLVIDKAGRIVIPKPLREALHLQAGDALEMESAGEQITLRPVRGTGPLTKEHGVWVFHSDEPLAAAVTDDLLQQIREERDLTNLGKGE